MENLSHTDLDTWKLRCDLIHEHHPLYEVRHLLTQIATQFDPPPRYYKNILTSFFHKTYPHPYGPPIKSTNGSSRYKTHRKPTSIISQVYTAQLLPFFRLHRTRDFRLPISFFYLLTVSTTIHLLFVCVCVGATRTSVSRHIG